jgi:hypothetical protein
MSELFIDLFLVTVPFHSYLPLVWLPEGVWPRLMVSDWSTLSQASHQTLGREL